VMKRGLMREVRVVVSSLKVAAGRASAKRWQTGCRERRGESFAAEDRYMTCTLQFGLASSPVRFSKDLGEGKSDKARRSCRRLAEFRPCEIALTEANPILSKESGWGGQREGGRRGAESREGESAEERERGGGTPLSQPRRICQFITVLSYSSSSSTPSSR